MWQWSKEKEDWWPKVDDDGDGEKWPTPFEVGYAWFNVLAQLSDFTDLEYKAFENGVVSKVRLLLCVVCCVHSRCFLWRPCSRVESRTKHCFVCTSTIATDA